MAGEEGSTPREGRLSEDHHANDCADHHHHHDLVMKGLPMAGEEGSTPREGHVSGVQVDHHHHD